MAGVTVGNIEIQISSNAQNAISSLSKLSNATNTSSSSMKNLESNVKNISRATQKMSGSFNNVTSIIATSLGFGSLNQAINSFIRLATESTRNAISLIENYNLFTVSMKGASTTQEEYNANLAQGIDFQNQLNNAFGVAIMDSMRYQGFFRNLANSLGLSNDASMTLSENLTKLTYDLSSLYNTDFATMYSKLQSGLVGQTKPLRSIGVDVTQQTLQPTLYNLGIDKKVTELTQAQKVMLRYIEILRQTTSAQGDMARTIETPANQLRILKDQWKELTMWLGTLFIGVLGKVLPYLNGIVIAFKNVFKYISDIFGFKLSDYQFATVSEDAGLIDDALSEAVDTSEELKKSLAGFDELNVLSQDTTTSPLTEDLSVTAALENAMSGYNNLMDSVKTKASEFSDKILGILGFQKVLNEDTGLYEIKWKGLNTQVSDFIIGLEAITALIGALALKHFLPTIIAEISKIITAFMSFGEVIATDGMFSTSLMTIGDIIAAAALPLAVLVTAVTMTVAAIVQLFTEATNRGKEFRQYWYDFISSIGRLVSDFASVFLPMIKPIGDLFLWVWNNAIKYFWDQFVNMVASISNLVIEIWLAIEPLTSLFMKVFGGIAGFLVDIFGGTIAGAFYLFFGIVGSVFQVISTLFTGITNLIHGFRTDWDATWSAIGGGIAAFFQPAIDFFNGFVDWFVNKINSLITAYNAIPALSDISTIKIDNTNKIPNPVPTPTYTPVKIPTTVINDKLSKIYQYADGGFPTSGQMFIAREAGPEMVGTIGGKSAVANNNDIVSAISQGVYNAMSSAVGNGSGQTVELIVDDMVFGRVVINSANKVQKNTNLKLETF